MKLLFENRRGIIGLLTTLVINFALITLAVTLVLNGISSRTNAFQNRQSQLVFVPVESCAENALVLLSRDNSYTGAAVTISDVSCSVSISGTGNNRDIIVSGIRDLITRDLFLRVQLTPTFDIIEWTD